MQDENAPKTFATTHWSMVLSAQDPHSEASKQAMATLCETYWYPLYAFVRRSGKPPEDAEDLTQGFFTRFLDKRVLNAVDRSRGRFRSFLLASMKNYMSDDHDRATAQKRGGGRPLVSLDAQQAEERYRLEPAHDLSPERLFERRWALSLLATVFERLENDYAEAGKAELFRVIQAFLSPNFDTEDFQAAAKRLEMKEGTLRMAVHRLRQRYGRLLQEEVANTVEDSGEVEDEIRHLRAVLGE